MILKSNLTHRKLSSYVGKIRPKTPPFQTAQQLSCLLVSYSSFISSRRDLFAKLGVSQETTLELGHHFFGKEPKQQLFEIALCVFAYAAGLLTSFRNNGVLGWTVHTLWQFFYTVGYSCEFILKFIFMWWKLHLPRYISLKKEFPLTLIIFFSSSQ